MKIFGIKITPLVIFFLVLAVVAIAYANMVAFPLSAKIAELNVKHQANLERIALLDQTIADERKINAEIEGYKSQIALRASIQPTLTLDARAATDDILGEVARASQVVISSYTIGAPEPLVEVAARGDGSRLYKVAIAMALRGTGSNAEDDIRSFLRGIEQREDAAYYVENLQIGAAPAAGTAIAPSMNPEGAAVNMTVSLYYYGLPTYGSSDVPDPTTAQ